MTGYESVARALALVMLLLVPVGCQTGPDSRDSDLDCDVCGETRVLSVLDGWRPVDSDGDPFIAHRPAEFSCPDFGYGPEAGFFEVNTGECNYGTFAQPLQYPIVPGDQLSFVFNHLALWGPDGAHAHVAVQMADTLLWERDLPLPVPASTVVIELTADRFVDAGEDVYFHVHNHGSNSYRMGELIATPSRAD